MLRVKDRQHVPKGGYSHTCPHCGYTFQAHTLGRLTAEVRKHRTANAIVVPPNLTAELEDQWCQSHPTLCEDAPGTPPTLIQQASNFAKSMWRWSTAGFPTVEEAVFNHRAAICQGCNHFKGWGDLGVGRCKLCGCVAGQKSMKLWMATERCPDNPSRW